MRPLEVEFADLNLTVRQVSRGRRAPGAAMAEQDLL
jgi:hypothetical protein